VTVTTGELNGGAGEHQEGSVVAAAPDQRCLSDDLDLSRRGPFPPRPSFPLSRPPGAAPSTCPPGVAPTVTPSGVGSTAGMARPATPIPIA